MQWRAAPSPAVQDSLCKSPENEQGRTAPKSQGTDDYVSDHNDLILTDAPGNILRAPAANVSPCSTREWSQYGRDVVWHACGRD